MRNRPAPGCYRADFVEDVLEQAGRTLVALPWAGCFPAGLTCLWPEVGGGAPGRFAVPSTYDITVMSEAYGWIPLISDPDKDRLVMMRRLVLMRSLVMPDSEAVRPIYCYPWRRLSSMLNLHRDTLQARWGRGIDLIVSALNRPGLCARAGGRVGPSPATVAAWMQPQKVA